jgi:hypothetical protein
MQQIKRRRRMGMAVGGDAGEGNSYNFNEFALC